MGNAYKVSVTDLLFCVIWHDKHFADWLAALATKKGGAADAADCVEELWKERFLRWMGPFGPKGS